MRKPIAVVVAAGLLLGAAVVPAQAGKKKKKAKSAPIATTLFLEGTTSFGEQEMTNVPTVRPGTYLQLAAKEGSGEKSMGIPNYVGGPNPKCAGSSLVPVFVGGTVGQVTGDLKVTFLAQATPGQKVEVRVWPDVMAQACNDSYVEPAGVAVVDLPTSKGVVEATIPGLDFAAVNNLMIQITPVIGAPPGYGRAFYGTPDTKVEFACLPPAGATSCVPS
ncbi:MAG TPA: hypothetical protein VG929_03325 [Actinomycetota bacterium]|nr:hypothetical protein [Actinomycetota bacterium]